MWQGVAWCVAIDVLYVGSLYAIRTPASRQHPTTVKWRMASVAATSCIAWLPVWLRRKQLLAPTGLLSTRSTPSLLAQVGVRTLLGLQVDAQLLPAVFWPLLLTMVLFSGPLLYRACISWQSRQQGQQGNCRTTEPVHNGGQRLHLYTMRDCVVAPITEEWCFRACMVPLLWMEGANRSTIIFMTPLFFGLGHLHHARELLLVHHWPLPQVVQVVGFQLLYTTVFGWYASWVFMATGKFAAAVLVHSFCNMMGVPAFGSMAAHVQGRMFLATTVAGVAAFAMGLWHWCLSIEAMPAGSVYLQKNV